MRWFDDFFFPGAKPPLPRLPRGTCQVCGNERTLRTDATMPRHTIEPGQICSGSYTHPAPTTEPTNTDITNTDPANQIQR